MLTSTDIVSKLCWLHSATTEKTCGGTMEQVRATEGTLNTLNFNEKIALSLLVLRMGCGIVLIPEHCLSIYLNIFLFFLCMYYHIFFFFSFFLHYYFNL